jgi:hypothetical protein
LPAVLLLAASTPAFASDDVAHMTWEELIQRATEANARGDSREALAWAQKAAAIRLSPSLRVFVLGAQRAVGDAAGAYTNARMCVSEAEADLKLVLRDKILATCRDAISALAPSIAQLSVILPSPLPQGIKVTVNGDELLPALLALPYPVNPGLATVEVSAPGYAPFHQDTTVGAAAIVPVTVTLQREDVTCSDGQIPGPDPHTCVPVCTAGKASSADGKHCCWPGQAWASEQGACAGAPQCPPGLIAEEGDCVIERRPPLAGAALRPSSSIPLYVAGAGAMIAIGGTIAWVVASSKYSTLQGDCGGINQCVQSRFDSDASSVKTFDALSVVGWTVGGAALAGGGLWYLLSGSTSAHSSTTVGWQIDLLGRTASISGAF